MPLTSKKQSGADSYFTLVRAFPLRRLRTASDHTRAKETYLELSRGKPDRGTRQYLEVLVDLIAEYERRSGQTIDTSSVSASELIRHRLEVRGMSVSQLSRETGIPQPNLSEMLNGSRDWSKSAIRALSKLLNIRAERFLI
jgi:antitoxin component HigA of HigAB toxin-antitoxin module